MSSRPALPSPVAVAPLRRLIDHVTEIMESDDYGALRSLFLESRALRLAGHGHAKPA